MQFAAAAHGPVHRSGEAKRPVPGKFKVQVNAWLLEDFDPGAQPIEVIATDGNLYCGHRMKLADGEDFPKACYSRSHTLTFDGGTVVPASASPHVVGKWAVTTTYPRRIADKDYRAEAHRNYRVEPRA